MSESETPGAPEPDGGEAGTPPAATAGAGKGGAAKGVSRKSFLQASAGAGVGGLIIGGAIGYAAHGSSSSSSGKAGSKGTLKIGSATPITGPFAGDGQAMRRGQELAVSEINATGGVLGQKLELVELDSKDQAPDVMRSVIQKLVSEKVAAIFVPFATYTNVDFKIAAASKIPTFHVNTWHGNVDYVRQNKITNIFQGDPTEQSYGSGFIGTLKTIIDAGTWKPATKTVFIVASNDPYSLAIAKAFQSGIEKEGWKTLAFDEYTVPQADWGGVMAKLRDAKPDVVFHSSYAAGDEASFIKQFQSSPTKSLVYQQYAPSIPQYLQLAGSAANGVLWSTVVGVLQRDPVAEPFIKSYTAKFGTGPGFSNAGDQYDLMHIWAQAAALADDANDFAAINAILRQTRYRGVCGAYNFNNDGLTCIAYPDATKDPSIGMPHLTFQIQDGKQIQISPEPYVTGTFQLPPWL